MYAAFEMLASESKLMTKGQFTVWDGGVSGKLELFKK